MKLFNFFKKQHQFAETGQTPTATRQLFNEQAIYQVWDELAQETDAILQKLGQGRRDLTAIEFDDEVSAALETRRDALISTPWRLEGNEAIVEFVTDQIKQHMTDLLCATFNARLYGYSVIETVYRRDNGRICLDKTSEKPFYWFEPKRNGELKYFGEDGRGLGEIVDKNKFLLTQCQANYDNPLGIPLLSKLYWPVHYRKHGWQFWLKWLERYGFPTRVGKTPSGILPDGTTRADDLSSSLQGLAQNSTIVVNDDQEIDLLEPNSNGEHFPQIESAINKRIQKTILGQTLTSDSDGKGSYALGNVHNDVRNDKRMSDVRLATRTIQHLVNVIVGLNFPNQSVMFVMEDERGIEKDRAERDKILIDAGAIELTEEYLLDRYDFNPGDFTLPEKSIAIPGSLEQFSANEFQFAAKKQTFTPDQQAVEDLADSLPKFSPIQKQAIESAIRAATSPEDLEQRLAVVLQGADLSQFSQVMEQALFAADVMGYAHAD